MSEESYNKNNIHGWVFIDKPIGMSSNKVLQKIKKLFLNAKAGYVGTLDPLASGFLPIAIGKATKTIKYLNNENKEYEFTINWGIKTSTGDVEGSIIEKHKKIPTKNEIEQQLKTFIGDLEQIPSKYSSIKINGKRAYKLVRQDKDFDMPKRKIKIEEFKLKKIINERKAVFKINCSSGTYVRTIVEDFAKILGTVGHLTSLRRIGFGKLDKKLISLDSLISFMHIDKLIKVLKPVDYIFEGVKKINIKQTDAKLLLDGNFFYVNSESETITKDIPIKFVIASYKNKIIAIGKINDGSFYPQTVMNLNIRKN